MNSVQTDKNYTQRNKTHTNQSLKYIKQLLHYQRITANTDWTLLSAAAFVVSISHD